MEHMTRVERKKKEVLKFENWLHCTHNNWICHKSFNIYICIWIVSLSKAYVNWGRDRHSTRPWKRKKGAFCIAHLGPLHCCVPRGKQEATSKVNSRTRAMCILALHLIRELDFVLSLLRATSEKSTVAAESQRRSVNECSPSTDHSPSICWLPLVEQGKMEVCDTTVALKV